MYTARAVSAVLGIRPTRLRSYLRAGVVSPTRDQHGQLRFTFEDLVLLRRAEGLVQERIPARRVCQALKMLRRSLPQGSTVAQVQIACEGQKVVVADGRGRWHPDSGQTVFDFAPGPADMGATVTPLAPARVAPDDEEMTELSARELYERGCALETTSADAASAVYRAALEQEPEFPDAHVNLGRLLHEAGDVYAALVHYRAALALRPGDTTAAFNIGVALEDLGATVDAIAAYRRALECNPRSADTHYNLARLLEQDGKPDLAVRHLLLYRQLTKKR